MPAALPLSSEKQTIAKLASMALMGPMQVEMVQREMRGIDNALHGQAAGLYEAGRNEDMLAADMSLLVRGERERAEIPVPDAAILRDMHARNKETLQMGTPPPLTQLEKNKLWKMVKEWRSVIQRGMPSYDQLERPTQENLDVFMRHESATMKHQLAFRNAMRMLDHENETVFLESLRPTTPSHIDWDAYYAGFEKLHFSDEAELRLQIDHLDEDVYLAYLRLRAQGVETPKLIMRTLNLSQTVYEACKVRLETEMAEVQLVDEDAVSAPKRGRPRKGHEDAEDGESSLTPEDVSALSAP